LEVGLRTLCVFIRGVGYSAKYYIRARRESARRVRWNWRGESERRVGEGAGSEVKQKRIVMRFR